MADYLATTVDYDGRVIGLVYLQSDDNKAYFAMSSGREGLIRAVINASYMFDEELMDNCLVEIQELEIPTLPSEFSPLYGTWAQQAYLAFMRVLSVQISSDFTDRTQDLKEATCTFFSTDRDGFFVLYGRESKIIQVFSKEQIESIWSLLPPEVSDENRLCLHRQIREATFEYGDGSEPCIWEHEHSSFMGMIFLMNGMLQKEQIEFYDRSVFNRPWKYNYVWN